MLNCQILFEHAWSFPTLYIFLSWHKYTIPWFFWSSRHFPHADSIFPQLPPAVRSSQLETSAWDHKQTSSFLPGVPSCLKKISPTDGVLEDQWQLYQIHVRAYGSSHPKKKFAINPPDLSTSIVEPSSLGHPFKIPQWILPTSYLPWYESPQQGTLTILPPPPVKGSPPHPRWQCRRLLVDCPPGASCSLHGFMDAKHTNGAFLAFPLKKGDGNNHLISTYFHILFFLRIILVFFLHVFIFFIHID